MKNYQERTESINSKAKKISKRNSNWLKATACVCTMAILFGVLIVPIMSIVYPQNIIPNVDKYKHDAYFPLIAKINEYNATNYREIHIDGIGNVWFTPEYNVTESGAKFPTSSNDNMLVDPTDPSDQENGYQETTLNQVDGVIEGDIVKRTRTHAFYVSYGESTLNIDDLQHEIQYGYKITAYSLEKENSQEVGSFVIKAKDDTRFTKGYGYFYMNSQFEMFISEDGNTATFICVCYNKDNILYTCLVSLDISQPDAISEKGRTYVAGNYLSSRKVGDEILVITNFSVPHIVDFDDKQYYIPNCGAMDNLSYLPMGEIIVPEDVSRCSYTVVAKVQEDGLAITDKQALFSYTEEVAVSKEHIFVTRSGVHYEEDGVSFTDSENISKKAKAMSHTEIIALTYKTQLQNVGCMQVDGTVKDRYSMDEQDGILRIATTTREYTVEWAKYLSYGVPQRFLQSSTAVTSASLFCVDIATQNIVAKVENFAPKNETVQAARFNGNTAYVCTAVRNTDPVFAFDLSDLSNITMKDTGTIPGYSISLLPFGENLLGIGYGATTSELKIELFRETEDGVESVESLTKAMCNFSTEYKSHFVDAQRQLVGLEIYDYDWNDNGSNNKYLLLHFNGSELEVLYFKALAGDCEKVRAFYDDGLYILSDQGNGIHYLNVDELLAQAALVEKQ